MNWQYQPPNFNLPPQGNYSARISNAIWDVSKSSNRPMIVITLAISQHKETIKYYIASDISAQIFCKAFNVDPYDINSQQPEKINRWIGATGGINIIHEERNGATFAHAKCLTQKQAAYIPPYRPYEEGPSFNNQQPQPQQPQPQQQPQQQPANLNWEQNGFNNQQQPQQRHDFNSNTTNLSDPQIPF